MIRRVTLLLLVAVPLLAQTKGTINGDVTDSSGAAVPGAKVKVVAPSIGLERDTVTNERGSFTVTSLQKGTYEVFVESPGFKTLVRSGINLDTDQATTLKLQLDIGQIADKVDVTAEASQVETSNGDVSRLVTGEQLRNYALPGRNPYYMLGIEPGIISRYGNFTTDFRGNSYSMGGLMINGGKKDMNFVTLDGVSNSRSRDNVQVNNILGVDFIEEVKVYTSRYAPEFGRSTGAQINFITRRGTQDFHMSAYEFFMSNQFAAKQFVTGDDPRMRYHNYGYTLGGPIYIPKVWNQDKSKLFAFFGYEARYQAGTNTKTGLVPTALERAGNFTQTPEKQKPRDPKTGEMINIIDPNKISNFGKALQKIYPDPNFGGPGGNYLATRPQPTDNGDYIFRVDYNVKQNWQLSVRGLHGAQNFTSPFDNVSNVIPLFPAYRFRRGNNLGVSLTTTPSATWVNEFTAGYSDYREDFILQGDGYKRDTYGFNFADLIPGNEGQRIPNVSINGYQGFNGSGKPSYARTPTWTFRDNLTKIVNNHSLKFGFYIENMTMNELPESTDNGVFNFGNSKDNPNNTGNPWANALLGYFDSYSESGPRAQTIYKAYAREIYAQDSWRITKNFTLEYGLRYSLISPWSTEWNNQVAFMQRFWDPAKAPQISSNGSTIIPGTGDPYNGLVLPGSGFPESAIGRVPAASDPAVQALFRGVPKGFNPLRKTNFQPRFSFAWDIFGNGKVALRGGAGQFNGVTGIANSPWYLGGSRVPFGQNANVNYGSADNPGSGVPSNSIPVSNVAALPEEYKIPTVYNYNLGIQTELPFKVLLDVGYVGNQGRHMSYSRDINYAVPEDREGNPSANINIIRPYQGYGAINIVEPSTNSSYNSMQVSVRRRFSDLTFGVSYTLGKMIGYGIEGIAGGPQDPRNIRPERSEAEESRRHNLVVTHTYNTPWFRDQRGVLGRILGGWSINGVWTWTTGRLYNPGLTASPNQVANRPNVTGDWNLSADERSPFRYFNTDVFSRPDEFTYGNAGRFILRGPGTFDMSAFATKDVRVAERAKLQFRLEAFNALNHPYWTDLQTTYGQSNFGQVGDVATQRYIQLGAKFIF